MLKYGQAHMKNDITDMKAEWSETNSDRRNVQGEMKVSIKRSLKSIQDQQQGEARSVC